MCTRLWLVLLAGLVACGGDAGLDPLPLDITLQANPTTAELGDPVRFVVNASGGSLVGVSIDYGDGDGEQFPTSGARTARVTFLHVYDVAGVYQVRATVADAVAGTKDASLEVRIE